MQVDAKNAKRYGISLVTHQGGEVRRKGGEVSTGGAQGESSRVTLLRLSSDACARKSNRRRRKISSFSHLRKEKHLRKGGA